MTIRLQCGLRMWMAIIFLVLAVVPQVVEGMPVVSRPSLRLGFSIRMPRYSWAVFSCHIENPDKQQHQIMLRVKADQGLSQYNLFQDVVTILPSTVLEYKTDFMIEESESYDVEIFSDGKKLPIPTDDMLIKLLTNRSAELVAIVNDSLDLSVGAFTQMEPFKNNMFTSQFQTSQLPENWKTLEKFVAVVIVDPDYKNINSRQYNAIREYVAMGGMLVFAYPGAVPAAMNTPLADLVPIVPVKFRDVHELKSLKRFFPKCKGWPEASVRFLDGIAKQDTATFLSEGDLPLFVWKKYGLGSSRFSAIPLLGDDYRHDPDTWRDLLLFMLNHQQFFPDYESFGVALDEMTGFPIPKAELIRNLFLAYFSILAVLMIIGFVTRRSALLWAIAAVYAVVATAFVLHLAGARSEFKGKLLAAVELYPQNTGESIPVQSYYGIYSDDNVTMDVNAADENALLSAIPPCSYALLPFASMQNTKSRGGGMPSPGSMGAVQNPGQNFQISETFEIQRRNGLPLLADVNIRALTTRQFTYSGAVYGQKSLKNKIASVSLPEIMYSGKGMRLNPWKIPADHHPDYAFLLFPSGVIPLTITNGSVTLEESERNVFTSDRIFKALQDALLKGFQHSTPVLAFVEKMSISVLPLPEKTNVQGRKIFLYPVTERFDNKSLTIPADQIVLRSADTSTRMIMNGNHLKDDMEIHGPNSYSFQYLLPPIFCRIKPEEIQVEFSYLNQGGNIDAYPVIQAGKKKIIGKQVKPGQFVFRDPLLSECLDPLLGSGAVIVEAKEKGGKLDPAQKLRANQWGITKLRISVKGVLTAPSVPFAY